MNPKAHYPVSIAGWAYFLGALLLLTVGVWVQEMDFEAGMLITEYGLVFLPVILIGWFFKINLKSALRLQPLKLREVILIPVTVVMAIPVTLFLNLLIITAMAQSGKAYDMPIPTADSLSDLSILFFIISISAGICEEVFFRGMMLDAYSKRFGAMIGIAVSAVLFGLFHFNPQNLLGPIFLGLLFGYLVLITGSLMAGILAHITNNGVAVLLMYAANLVQNGDLTQGGNINMINENPEQMAAALLILGIIAGGCLLAVIGMLAVISNGRKLRIEDEDQGLTADGEEIVEIQESETGRSRIRVAEVVPLAMLTALYAVICYYLIVIKQ